MPVDENHSEAALVRNADAFRILVESIKDYAIFMLDKEGYVRTWSVGAERIKGYKAHEIIGKHFSEFYPPEARESRWPQRELELAVAEGRFSDEGWRVRKDGSMFWANVVITALYDENGNLYGFGKVTRDLTERREREEKIQQLNTELRARLAQLSESQRLVEARTAELQNLSSRLLQLQDEERRRVARELHDALGQELAALKMTLATPRGNPEKLAVAVPQALEIAEAAIKTVRSLSYLLHPPLLDEVGLVAALHWFVDGLMKRSGMNIQLAIRPTPFPRLTKDVETTVFRVVQEALTNVYRHSGSPDARVELNHQPEQVVLRVRDYGNGFFNGAASGTPARFGVGMSGMRERIKQFNGEFKVSPAEPGTLIEAIIPLYSAI